MVKQMNGNNKYSNDYYIVNQILAEWNPIGVPKDIAKIEYTHYISSLLQFRNDLNGMVEEMEKIVGKDMGLAYDTNNPEHRQDTFNYAKKIITAINESSPTNIK